MYVCLNVRPSVTFSFHSIPPQILHRSSQDFQARPTLTQLTICNPYKPSKPYSHPHPKMLSSIPAISDHLESFETIFPVIFFSYKGSPSPWDLEIFLKFFSLQFLAISNHFKSFETQNYFGNFFQL